MLLVIPYCLTEIFSLKSTCEVTRLPLALTVPVNYGNIQASVGKAERYVGVVKRKLQITYEARGGPRQRFALSSYDSHRNRITVSCRTVTWPKDSVKLTRHGERKDTFVDESNGDDTLMNVHMNRPGQSVRVQDYVTKK